ncbi:MAG: hypothetical protein ACFB0G_14995 [Leptolyngbyaceae cyanobacterium]
MGYSSDRSINTGGGNISGSFINTGINTGSNINISNNSRSHISDPEKQQLRQDLRELEASLKRLEKVNPQANQEEKQMYITGGTPKPVRDRLLAALTSGGKAAISEFLDNAYARVVVATIEGWRS